MSLAFFHSDPIFMREVGPGTAVRFPRLEPRHKGALRPAIGEGREEAVAEAAVGGARQPGKDPPDVPG